MNTIPSESDSNAILDRLLSGAGLHRDAQLAALLGVSPQAVSQARRKRKIPEGWVVKVSQQCGLSMDWLMFGKGDESTSVASHAPVASSTSQASTPAGAAVPDLDLLCIPLVAASLSAGVGSLQTEADVLDYFAFRSDWLCRKGNPDKMVLMKVYGDSMEPEICHGDMALIDQSKQQIYPHTIYAVGVNEEIYHPFQGLGHGGAVQGGNLLQSAAGGQELRAVLPGELGPQSRGSAHASIIGAAAPQAQDDFPPPPANRV